MKIIFMGTPEFAVPVLNALLNSEHQVVAVYTRAPKEAGRGQKLAKSPIHLLAEEADLTVMTPTTLKTEEEIAKVKSFGADIIVVAAYGMILQPPVLEACPYGCINIHPSSLPRWRGASPIQRSVMAGDKTSEVCIMKMDEGLDTGDVILRRGVIIGESKTVSELAIEMAELGGELLLEALDLIASSKAIYTPQHEEGLVYAHKLTKEDEIINWDKSAELVNCQIRALSPKPGAYFIYNNEIVKIITANYTTEGHNAMPGTVIDNELTIACGEGVLKPTLLQRAGKKMIYTDAFLRGFPIKKGAILRSEK
jgi:methionyl-tRNA formyltransferase